MASSLQPVILTLKAGAAVAKGKAVKKGADDSHVIAGSANTSHVIGIAQSDALAAEDFIEVAVGGGAKMLLNESVAAGNHLVSHTDGSGALPNTAGDFIIAKALRDGVAGDLVDVLIVHGQAAVSES